MTCTNKDHTGEIEKLDGTIVCANCEPSRSWDGPFFAVLINEAGEPHAEVELKRCDEQLTRKGLIYRLEGFDVEGATYRFEKFDPAGPYGGGSYEIGSGGEVPPASE